MKNLLNKNFLSMLNFLMVFYLRLQYDLRELTFQKLWIKILKLYKYFIQFVVKIII